MEKKQFEKASPAERVSSVKLKEMDKCTDLVSLSQKPWLSHQYTYKLGGFRQYTRFLRAGQLRFRTFHSNIIFCVYTCNVVNVAVFRIKIISDIYILVEEKGTITEFERKKSVDNIRIIGKEDLL